MKQVFKDKRTTIFWGDCREIMSAAKDSSIDSIVTDPPYELGFMGKHWDASGIAYDAEVWKQAYRILKPGGHMLVFGGTRTFHRVAVAIEDAGFEIRDSIAWCYGSGFPSRKISQRLSTSRPDYAGTKARHLLPLDLWIIRIRTFKLRHPRWDTFSQNTFRTKLKNGTAGEPR